MGSELKTLRTFWRKTMDSDLLEKDWRKTMDSDINLPDTVWRKTMDHGLAQDHLYVVRKGKNKSSPIQK